MRQCKVVTTLLSVVWRKDRKYIMKKYDKEYSTQYTPEKEYLLSKGIEPSFVKVINEVTTYKYQKTSELFNALAFFYAQT